VKQDLRSPQAATYRKLYNTARWHRTRNYQFQLDSKLCQWCLRKGYVTEAMVCHHIDKASKDSPSTFFKGPFVSLCYHCHDSDAQQEEKIGFSTSVGTDGWPIDDRHPSNRASHAPTR